ncbi:MAG: hypothetical protein HY649_07625 [Acidobacteria bacterium]|nr:hypothetical protein [Acidobacteriota bacterium]
MAATVNSCGWGEWYSWYPWGSFFYVLIAGCFDYSPDTPESNSGSGLLGQYEDPHRGIARPSNVIEAKTESSQGSHSAPFPRAIPEFFIKAFSNQGDAVFDLFLGSGTTMAAAALLNVPPSRDTPCGNRKPIAPSTPKRTPSLCRSGSSDLLRPE